MRDGKSDALGEGRDVASAEGGLEHTGWLLVKGGDDTDGFSEEFCENGWLEMGVVVTRDVATLELDGGFQTSDSSDKRGVRG